MPLVNTVKTLVKNKRIPYNYKVGEKSSAMPFDVKLSIDQDFKKTLLKAVSIFSLGVAGGIATGIVISKFKK
jgi:hypothetical protein